MKESIAGEIEVGDKVLEQVIFRFTDSEKQRILKELDTWHRHTPQSHDDKRESLNFVVNMLEETASFFCVWVKDALKLQDHRDELKTTLSALKIAHKQLEKVSENKLFAPRVSAVQNVTSPPLFLRQLVAKNVAVMSAETLQPLEKLIKYFEFELNELELLPKRTGRPSSDKNSELVLRIGEILRDFMGVQVTTYEGGLFFEVVTVMFEILELPSKGNQRSIRKAVKMLS